MNITSTLKNVNTKTGIGTIYIYIDLYTSNSRNRIFYKTPHKVESKFFQNGKVNGRTELAKNLNSHIQNEIEIIKTVIKDLEYKGKEINKNTLLEARKAKNEGVKDIITLSEEYINFRTDAKKRQIEKLNNLLTRLKEFSKSKKIYYSDINQKFIYDFTLFLQFKQQPSTINKTFAFLRQILNHYFNTGIIDDSFKRLNYPKGFKQKQMVFTEAEIKKLLEFQPQSNRLEKVKDLAMLQMFTGLRFSDAILINKAKIYNDSINISTQKTNQNIIIPLHANLKKLVEKYNYDLSCLKISNVNYNKYLKELVELAEIDSKTEYIFFEKGLQVTSQQYKYKLVGSHTYRRTFITNAIIQGIPLHVIQSITGHTSLKQLSDYVNIADEIKSQELNKLNTLFKYEG